MGLLPQPNEASPVCVATDASDNWGCGGWWGSQWFQFPWDAALMSRQIAVKELVPILIALVIWGRQWARRRVLCHCDNDAVVAVMRSRSSKEPNLMHLLRCLFFFEAHYGCSMSAIHIPGFLNDRADDLSRNRLSFFLSKVQGAVKDPTPIPPQLLGLLSSPTMDWTSAAWTQQFAACVRAV